MDRILFVSSNDEKYREIRQALTSCPVEVERISLDVPEIQALDPAIVAAFKARYAYQQVGNIPVLVEDTGLAITTWNGFPGALIKWVLQTIGEEGLCRQLNDWQDRRATATVALCLHDGQDTHTFLGTTAGTITTEPRGEHGFGWDSIFQPEGYAVTYGEMRREDKMAISMRARALEALREFLLDRGNENGVTGARGDDREPATGR